MNPVTEDNKISSILQFIVEQDVPVTEDKIIDRSLTMLQLILLGKSNKRLIISSGKNRYLGREIARVGRPPVGKWQSPSGMDSRIQPLTEFVAEQPSHESERAWQFSKSVAMGEEKASPIYLGYHLPVNDLDSKFARQVIKYPYVMIANKPCDLYTTVGH